MGLDYAGSIASDAERARGALDANRDRTIPWSDSWTVQDCVQHLGGVHHVVSKVIEGRPATDFGAFGSLDIPEASSPDLGPWMADGTSRLLEQLRTVAPDEECWSWWPEGRTPAFWARRMAQETVVHRWDAELGAGLASTPIEPELAADGVDEFLDVFVGMSRRRNKAPGAGETAHVHCTDTDGEWLITFPGTGARELRREHAKGDVAFRGPAEGLLLFLWGRVDLSAAGVEVIGDEAVVSRWRELIPPV